MFRKIVLIFSFVVSLILPTIQVFAQSPNAGFVQGNIWYSKDPFEEGDKIKIYTMVFNPDDRELSGTVIFFDKTVLLGKKDFKVTPKSAEDISIDWTVVAGDHTIFGKIENAKFLVSEGKYEEVYLADNETEKSTRSVSKKISLGTSQVENSIVDEVTSVIKEKAPEIILKPANSVIDSTEKIRQEAKSSSDNKKEEIKGEIYDLNKSKNSTEKNPLLKPFKYVELFFYTLLSMFLGNKILFYGIIALVIFFLLRFVIKKIF